MRRNSMQTLRESFQDDVRTETLRLYRTTGDFVARLPIDEALERYGEWIYTGAYSESCTEVSVWIMRNTTK